MNSHSKRSNSANLHSKQLERQSSYTHFSYSRTRFSPNPLGTLSTAQRYSGRVPTRSIDQGPQQTFTNTSRFGRNQSLGPAYRLVRSHLPSNKSLLERNRDIPRQYSNFKSKNQIARRNLVRSVVCKESHKSILKHKRAELEFNLR